MVLAVVVAVAFVLCRDVLSVRWICGGLAVAVLLYLPFLVEHGRSLLHSHAHSASTPPDLIHRFANTVHLTAAISSGD
ncbi:MAG: hypothetical protein ACXVQ3_04875 [Gaiellaceae bacterium]